MIDIAAIFKNKVLDDKELINYGFHAKPEFLWSNLPECAALRVPGKKSWFAVIGKVSKSKFGLGEEKLIEVLNLKADPETVSTYIKEYRAYPAYHMNKKCWYSIFLDNALLDEEIIDMLKKVMIW